MDLSEQEVYKKALQTWGKTPQLLMVVEEVSELLKEIMKNMRGRNNINEIADETADVEIMLEQLKMIYNIENLVAEHKKFKLNRLSQRLKDWNKDE